MIDKMNETGNNMHTRPPAEGGSDGRNGYEGCLLYTSDKSRSREKGGAGLGLHIVRSIVNLHGGDIVVRSVEGEYCEFVFSIPKPQKGKKAQQAIAASSGKM